MKRKSLDNLVIIIMISCGLYTTLTGLAMDVLNLPMLVFHNYTGYITTILAGIHLVHNWRRVKFLFWIRKALHDDFI